VDTAKRDSLNTSEDGGQDRSINRFTLDSPIEEEGGNLSIGQVSTSTYLERFVS
jgi:hypothetical protein